MASSTEPKSVSMILKQRQQSRSAAVAPKGGTKNAPAPGTGSVNESLNPVLPPLYPSAPKSIPLNRETVFIVKAYSKLSQYFRSNFSVAQVSKKGFEGFYVDRYTDQYKSPLALKPHLVNKLPDSKYPEELATITVVKAKPVFTRRKRRRFEDIFDEDVDSREQSPKKTTDNPADDDEDEEKEESQNIEDNEDIEDELDEEMDVGTDYALSYFDNGEGDDDDRDDDDGPTY